MFREVTYEPTDLEKLILHPEIGLLCNINEVTRGFLRTSKFDTYRTEFEGQQYADRVVLEKRIQGYSNPNFDERFAEPVHDNIMFVKGKRRVVVKRRYKEEVGDERGNFRELDKRKQRAKILVYSGGGRIETKWLSLHEEGGFKRLHDYVMAALNAERRDHI